MAEGKQMEASQLLSDPNPDNFAVVIAIDFGTAESGYAYAFASKDNSIIVKFNKNWAEGQGFHAYKTRTCVLVDSEGKFVDFGYAAEDRYINLQKDEQSKYEFYDRFKMALHKETLWDEETKLMSRSKKEAKAMDIFTMSLEFFMKHILRTFTKYLLSADKEMVRWVITVPAIWSVGAKQFMRKAAYRAGLTTREDSKRLMIALEPEAASLACRNLPLHRFTVSTRGNNLPHGTDYLLLDCGGGTVDIIAHKVVSDDTVKEIGKGMVKEIDAASGGPWGGVSVDDNLEQLMGEIFGTDFIQYYKTSFPPNWLKFMRKFEILKRSLDNEKDMVLEISIHFNTNYQKFTKKDFEETSVDGVNYSVGELTIKNWKVLTLFKPVIDKMIAHVKVMMSKPALKKVKYFFLVGGFGDCKILQDAVKSEFEGKYDGKIEVLIPPEASVAVMEGAVRFGNNPKVITHRMARKTYGFKTSHKFDASQHDESRKELYDGIPYCNGIFAVMIKKNEAIEVGKEYTSVTTPVEANQTKLSYSLYETDKDAQDVTYVDEDGMENIGELVVTSTDTSKGKDRQFLVNFCIGDTELYVNVADTSVDDGGGDVQEAKLNLVYQSTD